MVQVICEHVGILTCRNESFYGFLYLAFQEYSICLKFLEADMSEKHKFITDGFNRDNKIQLIAQSLSRHTSDLRFRVPIAFTFGKISSSWSQDDFDDLCYKFMQIQDEHDSLLPLGAYVLISCVDDFVNYPSNDILCNALDRLMIAASQHK